MDFKTATDRLMEAGFTSDDLAGALGLARQTIRAMRLDPSSSAARRPPENWRPALAALARSRGKELEELAAELDREAPG